MKRAKSFFNRIVDYENIRIAWLKVRKEKKHKQSLINYEFSLGFITEENYCDRFYSTVCLISPPTLEIQNIVFFVEKYYNNSK